MINVLTGSQNRVTDTKTMALSGAMAEKALRLRSGGTPRVLDLFSGCGGFSLGFHRAGFQIWAGVEIDPWAAASHAVNFHGIEIPRTREEILQYSRDIVALEPEQLVQKMGGDSPASKVDVLIGGPPCQSYARVGRAKLRQVLEHPRAFKVDSRGNLYLRYLHYVKALKPFVIVMENVPDVLNYGGHNVAEETAEVLQDLGYECSYTLLNSVFFGVPQMRERMFLIAYHRALGVPVHFPEPTHFWRLPAGYEGARRVAIKHLFDKDLLRPGVAFEAAAEAVSEICQPAMTAEEALGDLPRIAGHLSGQIRRGIRRLDETVAYAAEAPTRFAREMRKWPGFESQGGVNSHVIRSLPRDYKIFRRMNHGEQYPEAHARACRLFEEFVERCKGTQREVKLGSPEYEALRSRFVPPYDPGKFPNKWRKMSPDEPARTVMAHLGKDSYSHIHYDSRQARTISVREAARLQSFPDGFKFVGAMNSAFRQIGNAVPPMLAWNIARTIMADAFIPLADVQRFGEKCWASEEDICSQDICPVALSH